MPYDAEKGNFTVALAGDCMLTRRLSVFKEERFLALAEILRSADAAFVNLEGTVHTWDEGTPGITQGTTTLKLPITEAYVPNAFVSIVLVRGRSAPPGPPDDPGRPTLRVGYVVAPWEVMSRILALKTDAGTGALEQMVLAEYCGAHFFRHVPALRRGLRTKLETLMESLNEHFGTAAEFDDPKGGIFLWVKLADGVDTLKLYLEIEKMRFEDRLRDGVRLFPLAAVHEPDLAGIERWGVAAPSRPAGGRVAFRTWVRPGGSLRRSPRPRTTRSVSRRASMTTSGP